MFKEIPPDMPVLAKNSPKDDSLLKITVLK